MTSNEAGLLAGAKVGMYVKPDGWDVLSLLVACEDYDGADVRIRGRHGDYTCLVTVTGRTVRYPLVLGSRAAVRVRVDWVADDDGTVDVSSGGWMAADLGLARSRRRMRAIEKACGE